MFRYAQVANQQLAGSLVSIVIEDEYNMTFPYSTFSLETDWDKN